MFHTGRLTARKQVDAVPGDGPETGCERPARLMAMLEARAAQKSRTSSLERRLTAEGPNKLLAQAARNGPLLMS